MVAQTILVGHWCCASIKSVLEGAETCNSCLSLNRNQILEILETQNSQLFQYHLWKHRTRIGVIVPKAKWCRKEIKQINKNCDPKSEQHVVCAWVIGEAAFVYLGYKRDRFYVFGL